MRRCLPLEMRLGAVEGSASSQAQQEIATVASRIKRYLSVASTPLIVGVINALVNRINEMMRVTLVHSGDTSNFRFTEIRAIMAPR